MSSQVSSFAADNAPCLPPHDVGVFFIRYLEKIPYKSTFLATAISSYKKDIALRV